ncbi:MAG: response regulator transcription factor, partial [Clostridia bacterium]|nr:response regulator transcription factor [Deltaproteobacteria bacterium]
MSSIDTETSNGLRTREDSAPRVRILIADDHAILRSGLRMLINTQDDMEVIGEAADGEDAIRRVAELDPDIVLLDLSMPGMGGIRALEVIRERFSRTRVLVLTMHDQYAYVRSVLAAGGAGFVVKRAADAELLSAIRTVSQGRSYIDVSLESSGSLEEIVNPKHVNRSTIWRDVRLSAREREVVTSVAHGYTNQQIADTLGLSVKTVETYRARVSEKVGLRNRADLVRYALESGLLASDRTAEPPRASVVP